MAMDYSIGRMPKLLLTNLENLMRKLLLCLLLLPGLALACVQSVKVKQDSNGVIYVTYTKLQNLNNPTTSPKVQIVPLHCVFSTKYDGNITFIQLNQMKNNFIHVSKDYPYIYTFKAPIGYNPYQATLTFANIGCNSGADGDKCIQAKQQRLDDLIINCT
jgi:hypothetical protein